MTLVYLYLWICLGCFFWCIFVGLREDLRGPDMKFGYNLIRLKEFDTKTFKWVETFKPTVNPMFWIFVVLYSFPLLNLWMLYSTIRFKIEDYKRKHNK